MNYFTRIMNLNVGPHIETLPHSERVTYKNGHKVARHAAADIVIEAEREIEELKQSLQEMVDMWRTVCNSYGWDANHMTQYERAVETLLPVEW